MKSKPNVIFVDFRGRQRPGPTEVRWGSRLVTGVCLGLVVAEVLWAAFFLPSAIGSAFFGPTVIALAVAATLGLRRLVAGMGTARRRRRTGMQTDRDDPTERTLH